MVRSVTAFKTSSGRKKHYFKYGGLKLEGYIYIENIKVVLLMAIKIERSLIAGITA